MPQRELSVARGVKVKVYNRIKKIRKRDGSQVEFDQDRITIAIWKAVRATNAGTRELAEKLSDEVVRVLNERVDQYPERAPSIEDIQDVVEKILIESGQTELAKAYILYRKQHTELRSLASQLTSTNLVDNYLKQEDWRVRENANMAFSLQGLNVHVSGAIIAQYWLEKIYPPVMAKAHTEGDYHLHDLSFLGCYTYCGKETVIAKKDGRIINTSFERLYDDLKEKEVLLNAEDDAWAKYPSNLLVLDRDGWTLVKRVVKKAKQNPMHFIKNEGGRSVIVTDNHPMIVGENPEVDAVEARVVHQNHRTLTVDLRDALKNESLFSIKEIFLAEELLKKGVKEFWFDGIPAEELVAHEEAFLKQDATISANNKANVLPNRIELTENLGYLLGMYVAGGSSDVHKATIRQKDTLESKRIIEKIRQGAYELGCRVYERRKNGFIDIEIANTTFVKYLLKEVFEAGDVSHRKNLPKEMLMYDKRFVKGLVAGIVDGDGSVDSCGTRIVLRTASRTMLEQIATVFNLLGFTASDRNIEGAGSTRYYKGRQITQQLALYGVGVRVTGETLPSFKYASASVSSGAWREEGGGWHKILNNEVVEISDEYIYDITTTSRTLVVNGMWNHNCVGWDLADLLRVGFKGAFGKIESKPANHFRTALMQAVNFIYTLQGEAAGAQAFSSFDTLLAPFIRYDGLDYKQVKQALQEFLFNMMVPTRVGFQTPFSNVTLDLNAPRHMSQESVVVGGEFKDDAYGDFQEEMNLFNKAFCEGMTAGDAKNRVFTFPIPTYNITREFDWNNGVTESLFEMTAKYGIPYFANFINSDMKPEDTRSMCCRLRLDQRELRRRGGGLFGSNPQTGSVGVVTINMPRIGYLSRDDSDFFDRLEYLMGLARDSLEIKRKVVERFTDQGLYPYSRFYLRNVKQALGQYWKNHFNTIGLVGMNEALVNFMGAEANIASKAGYAFALKVLDFMRSRLAEYQQETDNIYNLEATPAEGTSYRLARMDKKKYPDIVVANNDSWRKGAAPFYTNSTHLPVGYTSDVFEALQLQDDLQVKYTGGTVFHCFLGERLSSWRSAATLVKKVFENFRLPYFSITPTFSVCPKHGYLAGEHEYCPRCDEEIGCASAYASKPAAAPAPQAAAAVVTG